MIVKNYDTIEYIDYLRKKTSNEYDPVVAQHLSCLQQRAICEDFHLPDYLYYISEEKLDHQLYQVPKLKDLPLTSRQISLADYFLGNVEIKNFWILEDLLHHPNLVQTFSKDFLEDLLEKYDFDDQIFFRLVYTKKFLLYHCCQIFEEKFDRFRDKEKTDFVLDKVFRKTPHLAADGNHYDFNTLMSNFRNNQNNDINDDKNFYLSEPCVYQLYLNAKDKELFFKVTPAVFFLKPPAVKSFFGAPGDFTAGVARVRSHLESRYNPENIYNNPVTRAFVDIREIVGWDW